MKRLLAVACVVVSFSIGTADEGGLRVDESVADRDAQLGQTVLAQLQAGNDAGAKAAFRSIEDPNVLRTTSRAMLQNAAQGGATGADFDSLINLITSTVAPNSWEDVGGPGAIVEFPGGVSVDTNGVLRKSQVASRTREAGLDLIRRTAKHDPNDPQRDSDLRMVSLTRLQRELQLRIAFGMAPTESMKHLAGLQEVRYLFLFPETNDVVVAGPAGDWQQENADATLLLDDFLVLLKNARDAAGRFGCSISPKQANLASTQRFLAHPTGVLKPRQTESWVEQIRQTLGLQNIEVHGVEPTSHVAHVLVEADYHMKLIGMGLEPSVPDVPGYLDSIDSTQIPTTMDVLRWWFTLRKDAIQKNKAGNAFVFDDVVQLKCENELVTQRGERVHTGRSTELNQQFAMWFTRHFDRLARRYPIYSKLESLFRLALVAALVHSDEVRAQVDFDPEWLIETLSTANGLAPKEVPSIVNHRVIDRRHIVVGVSGGVVVDAQSAMKRMRSVRDVAVLTSDQHSAEPRDQWKSQRWWWD